MAKPLSYFPSLDEFVLGPGEYLEQIRKTKDAVGIPVIGSLNGNTPGGWLDYAKQIQDAGADALELHVYSVPTNPQATGASQVASTVEMVRSVREVVSIPLAVKLSPFYSAFANVAKKLDEVGADGLIFSTASTSLISTSRTSKSSRDSTCPPRRNCRSVCDGSRSYRDMSTLLLE